MIALPKDAWYFFFNRETIMKSVPCQKCSIFLSVSANGTYFVDLLCRACVQSVMENIVINKIYSSPYGKKNQKIICIKL